MEGKVFKYGDHVDTDVIIPARYLQIGDLDKLSVYAMKDIDDTFVDNVEDGDIIVAGRNFGCGSSREHAPIVIKKNKVSCVIAKSFARIFFRNAINIGLPVLECEEAVNDAKAGDVINVDVTTGVIKNLTQNKEYATSPFPEFMQNLINAGGLVNYRKEEIANV